MTDLSSFAITARWPAKEPGKLQLYSFPTPNGVKVAIALEELGLPYEAHTVDITKNETWTEPFLSLNPNGKIPAIVDPDGPGGRPLALFESGAILLYLAEKTGKLLPADPARRYETIQWVFFQMAAIGPMFGQLGFFHKFAGREIEDKRPLERYAGESKRLVGVLEGRLAGRQWIMGDDYTIADIAIFPWVRGVLVFYEAGGLIGLDDTRFFDSTGLDPRNVSSPRDLVRLVAAAAAYPLIREFSTADERDVRVGKGSLRYGNSNSLVRSPEWQIGLSKTGFIREAGRCLVMQAWMEGEPVIIVLMNADSRWVRNTDANKLREWLQGVGVQRIALAGAAGGG